MASFNRVILAGNLTRDPDLKYLPSQMAVADFGFAVNQSWTAKDGTKKEDVLFIDCTIFGKLAEVIAQHKKKGDPLLIEGKLKFEQWEAQDGTKRSKIKVIVESFQFLNRSQGEGGYDGERQSAPQRPAARQQRATVPASDDGPPIRDDDIPF